MSQTTTMSVRISGALSEFVASNVGENGSYENVSEYVRDLIRRDNERAEQEVGFGMIGAADRQRPERKKPPVKGASCNVELLLR